MQIRELREDLETTITFPPYGGRYRYNARMSNATLWAWENVDDPHGSPHISVTFARMAEEFSNLHFSFPVSDGRNYHVYFRLQGGRWVCTGNTSWRDLPQGTRDLWEEQVSPHVKSLLAAMAAEFYQRAEEDIRDRKRAAELADLNRALTTGLKIQRQQVTGMPSK